MKAHEIIARSMRLIGATGTGESVSAAELADGLVSLNSMVDSWSAQRLFIYQVKQQSFPFSPSDEMYTIGPGGDWNTERPVEIQGAFSRINNIDSIITVTKDRSVYDDLSTKAIINTSWPSLCYYEASLPLGKLWFYPKPAQASTVFLDTWLMFPKFTAYDDVTFPPGYERAIVYSLAVEFAPEFGKVPSALVADIAKSAKAVIKERNLPEPVMSASLYVGRGGYNIISDGFR